MKESFGDHAQNSPDLNQRALEVISELIREFQGEAMVTSFVLLVETADVNDRYFSSCTAPGQKSWTSMGILEYALTFEKNFNVGMSDPNDEDDD